MANVIYYENFVSADDSPDLELIAGSGKKNLAMFHLQEQKLRGMSDMFDVVLDGQTQKKTCHVKFGNVQMFYAVPMKSVRIHIDCHRAIKVLLDALHDKISPLYTLPGSPKALLALAKFCDQWQFEDKVKRAIARAPLQIEVEQGIMAEELCFIGRLFGLKEVYAKGLNTIINSLIWGHDEGWQLHDPLDQSWSGSGQRIRTRPVRWRLLYPGSQGPVQTAVKARLLELHRLAKFLVKGFVMRPEPCRVKNPDTRETCDNVRIGGLLKLLRNEGWSLTLERGHEDNSALLKKGRVSIAMRQARLINGCKNISTMHGHANCLPKLLERLDEVTRAEPKIPQDQLRDLERFRI